MLYRTDTYKARYDMKNLYIVQPMRYHTQEEIEAVRESAWAWAEYKTGENLIPLDTYEPAGGEPLELLGRALQKMAHADYVVFVPGYGANRGCRIEQRTASEYGKTCLYMEE